jgi:hypothetical protein
MSSWTEGRSSAATRVWGATLWRPETMFDPRQQRPTPPKCTNREDREHEAVREDLRKRLLEAIKRKESVRPGPSHQSMD